MYTVTWSQAEEFVRKVVTRFEGTHVSGIYGLSKGGLMLASMLSIEMNVPLIMSPEPNCIVVNDIECTGRPVQQYANDDDYYSVSLIRPCDDDIQVDEYLIENVDSAVAYPWQPLW